MIDNILDFIEKRHPTSFRYWLNGEGDIKAIPLQDHCDLVYTYALLGQMNHLRTGAISEFVAHASGLSLYGRPTENDCSAASAHLTAYILGTIRLLTDIQPNCVDTRLYRGWNKTGLLDEKDLPIWPPKWSHHIWRVSHWIGGAMSIVLHLARSNEVAWADMNLVERVFQSCERHVLDNRTGQLKPYRSWALQKLFRFAYSVRHDPDLGDLGGVVHLLWVYHAVGRKYIGNDWLANAAETELKRAPFMESVPYCLDFDIVQLARTSNPLTSSARAEEYANSIAAFLSAEFPQEYTLHKLPGALATLHECALISSDTHIKGGDVEPIDIIARAYWL